MKKIVIKTATLGIALAIAVAGPAGAIGDESSTSSDQSTATTSTDSHQANQREKLQQKRQVIRAKAEQKRTSLKDRRDAFKEKIQARRATIKQNVCERKQTRLEGAITRLSKRGTNIKQRIDTVYDRVVAFYEKGKITVADYDGHMATIEKAKADVATSLALVQGQTFTLDCASDSVGQQLDGFRLSIKEAKTPLKQYRTSVVDLIHDMRSAVSHKKETNNEK